MRYPVVIRTLAFACVLMTTSAVAQPASDTTGDPAPDAADQPDTPDNNQATPGDGPDTNQPSATGDGNGVANSATAGDGTGQASSDQATGQAGAGQADKPAGDPATAKPKGPPMSAKQKLGPWWKRSSKFYDPVYPGFLYHIEGQYSFMFGRGNVDITAHTGQLMIALRKSIVTGQSQYRVSINKTTLNTNGTTVEQGSHNLSQVFYVDILKQLAVAAGAVWETDIARFIDNRFTFFGGVNSHLVIRPRYQFGLGAYYGYETTSFDNERLGQLVPGLSIPSSNESGVLLSESFSWVIHKQLMFQQSAEYLQYFDEDRLFRWTLRAGLNIIVTPTISIVNSLVIVNDKNRISTNPVQALMGYGERDTRLMIGVKLAL